MAALLLVAVPTAHGQAAGATDAGARLAAAHCISCHASSQPIHATVPLLEGQPHAYFRAQWRAFRERQRTNPAMVNLAAQLSEQDVAALADYYAAQLPPASAAAAGSTEAGRALAERLRCASCHGAGLEGTSAGAARLAGQKPRATAWALQMMRGGTRPHGSAAKPDPLVAPLGNAEIEALAEYFGALR